MLKHLQIILFLALMPSLVSAQQYGNEWIPFSAAQTHSLQQYFKISVTKEGVFRLSNSALLASNVPVNSIDHRRFQLFLNGTEQFIYVNDINSNNFLDNGDYIEFYGKRNDGWLDAQMFDSPLSQANPNYSMINDTAAYFLTWNSSLSNKRIQVVNDTNYGAYVSSNYFFREIFREYTSRYFNGSTDAYSGSDPDYTAAEGWFDSEVIEIGVPRTKTLPVSNLFSSGPDARLTSVVVGASNHSVFLDHHLQIKLNNNLFVDTIYDGYILGRYDNTIPNSWLTGGNANILFTSLTNNGSSTDKNSVSWLKLRYPHSYSFAGETDSAFNMIIPYNISQAKTLLNITGFSQTNSNVFIYDLDSKLRIPLDNNAGTLRALIPNSTTGTNNKNVFLFAENSITYLNTIKPVNTNPDPTAFAKFTNYNLPNSNYNYIIITHKSLMTSANSYKNYRNSTGNISLIVDVDELYDQFAYGINKHPLAIRNFGKFAYFSWNAPPKHMFLIGKSISAVNTRIDGNGIANPTTLAYYAANLVPTFGNPAADVLFTIGYNSSLYTPAFSVGRLSAKTNNDVSMYLNKVISHESQPTAEWMKHILHFGGGSDINEQNLLKSYLNIYEDIIEGPNFGGFVNSYFKTSSDPIQINQSNVLKARIDSGVTMMTFFAHANATNFDISTDQPSNYTNKDRYPLILANACYAGDIHTPGRSQSEDFVLQDQKGAIGFIAQVFLGYREPLHEYSTAFYKVIGVNAYGTTIGEAMVATIDSIEAPFASIKTVCLEMTLHGDPALRLNPQAKPDMVINQPDIYFTPANITTELDSFDVNIVMTNIGRAVTQQFNVELKRTFPDGSNSISRVPHFGLNYRDTVSVKLPVNFFKGAGLNRFDVVLDPDNLVDEIDNFFNNNASNVLNIQSNDITPAYPFDFAIIPNNTVVLKASTSNPFATSKPYVFEIDTTDNFNSPIKQRVVITQKGGIVKTSALNLNYQTVYYWRVSVDSVITGTYKWRQSSFISINGVNGWSQAHLHQFKNDKLSNMQLDIPDRKFEYVTNSVSLNILNSKNPFLRDPQYNLNNSLQETGSCTVLPSMHIAVLDAITLEPWETFFVDTLNCFPPCIFNPQNNFGNVNNNGACRKRTEKYFIFRSGDPAQRAAMKDMINQVPAGNYIIAYSSFGGQFENWENDVYQTFEDLGSDSIRLTLNMEPYIFVAKKGDPSSAIEVIGHSPNDFIEVNTVIQNFWSQGYVQSPLIGPAKDWTSIHWQQNSLEAINTDSVSLDVIGIRPNGSEILLMPNVPASQTDILNLSSIIPATDYPYIRLRMNTQDNVNHTPAQLDRWQVYYQGVPEAALNPNAHFTFSKDTIQQGQTISMSIAVENISPFNMDSLKVDYYVFNNNKVKIPITTIRHRPLPAGDTLITRVNFSTETLPYLNSLWVEANPDQDQPEQAHYNNLGEVKFYATRDVTNPILDVTFDGARILDGDIISAKPAIVMSLDDENRYLAITDPANFLIFLRSPDGVNRQLFFESAPGVSSNDTLLKWFPASLPKNAFRIEFNPTFSTDGIYELKVQGKDASENLSGRNDYRVSFEVINTSTITQVMNYPNPFSTSTRFVFTLTGSETPDYFKIQILTVTGKVVREITGAELGPIRVGRNITEYAWDGKDEFGDRLANGVYLYRVITKINNSGIELRQTAADSYFKSGFGKMYLMR